MQWDFPPLVPLYRGLVPWKPVREGLWGGLPFPDLGPPLLRMSACDVEQACDGGNAMLRHNDDAIMVKILLS
jgi:hypothetical protein